MRHGFDGAPGAKGFACSNVNPLLVASCKAALEALRDAGGIPAVRRKSLLLTTYLELLLGERGLLSARAASGGTAARCAVELITPVEPANRGCQLSMRVRAPPAAAGEPTPQIGTMRELEGLLADKGCATDARDPDVVRAAPAPLYNSFSDVRKFVELLETCLEALVKGSPAAAAAAAAAAAPAADFDIAEFDRLELEKKKAAEAKKQAEKDAVEAENLKKMAQIEKTGKRAAGGLHKFDPDEVDVHGGDATADDFMDAFGF